MLAVAGKRRAAKQSGACEDTGTEPIALLAGMASCRIRASASPMRLLPSPIAAMASAAYTVAGSRCPMSDLAMKWVQG